MIERYFDNAATTPMDPRVLDEMLPYLRGDFGNAHSIHESGRKAEAAVELARERVASLLVAEDPSQVTFTSGATESNNWVLNNFTAAQISPYEHSSVLEPAKHRNFQILPPSLVEGSTDPPLLISIMRVNNETGTMWDVRQWRRPGQMAHTDATQAVGKIASDYSDIEYLSFSGHKLYGPKGVGGLLTQGPALDPFIQGGEQEMGQRGGTLNVPAIVGLGAAAAIAEQEWEADARQASALREIVLAQLKDISDWQVNGGPNTSSFILSLTFRGVLGETLVIELDQAGFAISSGAACSSRSTEPSHVLLAFGLDAESIRATVRISFGRFNSEVSALNLGRSLAQNVEKLRRMK